MDQEGNQRMQSRPQIKQCQIALIVISVLQIIGSITQFILLPLDTLNVALGTVSLVIAMLTIVGPILLKTSFLTFNICIYGLYILVLFVSIILFFVFNVYWNVTIFYVLLSVAGIILFGMGVICSKILREHCLESEKNKTQHECESKAKDPIIMQEVVN
jgi:hypothetical protein